MKDYEKFLSSRVGSHKMWDYQKFTNNLVSPTIIEERKNNIAAMDIFSRLMADRIIFLGTEIDSDVANIITSQLLYLNTMDDKTEIKLFINSPGGSIIDGLAIYDMMQYISPNVETYAIGLAASMGAILLSSGTKGKRYALPHSRIMIHQPMGGIAPGTQESDIKIAYEEIKQYKDTLYQILSKNTGVMISQIKDDADRDHWFNAHEAQGYGLIDEVLIK